MVGPIVAFVAGSVVGSTKLHLAVIALFGLVPPAVLVFMLALEFSENAEEVARTVVVSTLGAFSVSVVVVLLGQML